MENIEKKGLLEKENALINSSEDHNSESDPSEHVRCRVSEQCFDILSSVAKARRRARNPLTPDEERALKKDYFKRLQLNFYSPKNTYLQYIFSWKYWEGNEFSSLSRGGRNKDHGWKPSRDPCTISSRDWASDDHKKRASKNRYHTLRSGLWYRDSFWALFQRHSKTQENSSTFEKTGNTY